MCHFVFECPCTLLLWLYLKISKLMIASVLSSQKDRVPTGSNRIHHPLSHSLVLAHTPYSTDLVPVIKRLFVHCVQEFFFQLRATMKIPYRWQVVKRSCVNYVAVEKKTFLCNNWLMWGNLVFLLCTYSCSIGTQMAGCSVNASFIFISQVIGVMVSSTKVIKSQKTIKIPETYHSSWICKIIWDWMCP